MMKGISLCMNAPASKLKFYPHILLANLYKICTQLYRKLLHIKEKEKKIK